MDIVSALSEFGIDTLRDIDAKVQGRAEMLDVVRDEIIERCKREYRARAKRLHPDVVGESGAEGMKRLNEALSTVKEMRIVIDSKKPVNADFNYFFMMMNSATSANSSTYSNFTFRY
jgi:hypothetical protein